MTCNRGHRCGGCLNVSPDSRGEKNVRTFIIGESSGQKQVKTSLLQNKADRENREMQEINVSEGQKV